MRILLVGAGGMLGSAVATALGDHEVIGASRSGDHPVDLTDHASIQALYDGVGGVDAVVCAAGVTPYAPFTEIGLDDVARGVADKLMGQVALVRLGLEHVSDGGSFTLVGGILADDPIATGSVSGLVNGGIHAFVRCAAIELPRGLRINAVSSTVFAEAWDAYGDFFPGYAPVPVADAARAFVKSVEGAQTGQTYRVGY